MLPPDVRAVIETTPIAHLATVLPDGSPHSVPLWIATHGQHVAIMTSPTSRKARNLRRDPRLAISLTPTEDPFRPVTLRGRVADWLIGEPAWTLIDQISTKYIGAPYSREHDRTVALIEVEHHSIG